MILPHYAAPVIRTAKLHADHTKGASRATAGEARATRKRAEARGQRPADTGQCTQSVHRANEFTGPTREEPHTNKQHSDQTYPMHAR